MQNWFGEVGGLDRMFNRVARWLVGGIAGRKWINAILGSLYMMKKHKEDDEEDKKEGGTTERPLNNQIVPSDDVLLKHKSLDLKQHNKDGKFVTE